MDIPYGFDCYSFVQNEIKYFEPTTLNTKWSGVIPYDSKIEGHIAHEGYFDQKSSQNLDGYVRFTRKNEYYTDEQLGELTRAGKLGKNDLGRQIFCGIKIQIGISVVTNFLKKGMQYRKPVKGHSFFKNGTWTGIVSGLTVDSASPISYDMAFGNFLAYDEEFPYMSFGPFYAVESKLVLLTGSSRRVEASSFGTNISGQIWLTVLSTLLILSLLASLRVHWQYTKYQALEAAIGQLVERHNNIMSSSKDLPSRKAEDTTKTEAHEPKVPSGERSLVYMMQNFFFIYFTMLLNKPCIEFDELIWPRQYYNNERAENVHQLIRKHERPELMKLLNGNADLRHHYGWVIDSIGGNQKLANRKKPLPTSIRVVSYLWSAACLVMASIYSGEMLAVILLHTDTNVDTIQQLINSKPPIEPVIRQDDFTYTLMLKSLDKNMLVLHNITRMVPRPEVYTRRFIESISERKQALLGDDELIETIYDIYHKYFPLHRSQVSYLQYPISIMYRKDLSPYLENQLRRGIVQIFEMGLVHRWYQAQKDTYIHFYDRFEKKENQGRDSELSLSSDNKYKPLSIQNFYSFFQLMCLSTVFAFLVLVIEIVHAHYSPKY